MRTTVPLYQQLAERPYPSRQCLDKASIDWLFDRARPRQILPIAILDDYIPFPLEQLRFESSWFVDSDVCAGLHGVRHLLRVSLFAWIIVQRFALFTPFDADELNHLLQAALVHDIRRQNDNADPEHGMRSAAWAHKHLPSLDSAALFAIRHHADTNLPHSTSLKATSMLRILKTADALDRFRLPKEKWWPNRSLMPLPVDEDLLELAKYITLSTEKISLGLYNGKEIEGAIVSWLQQAKIL